MYSITKLDDKITRYEIRDEKSGNYFRVAPERGGIVTDFSVGQKDVLWMDWDTFYDTSRYVWGGIPVLFPNCGMLENNTAVFNGRDYTLPLHGIARNFPWAVRETYMDALYGTITLGFSSNGKTREQFPFDFTYDIKYTLTDNLLDIKLFIKNISAADMPVHFGFHPYFTVTGKGEKLVYDTPCTRYMEAPWGIEKPFRDFPVLTEDRNGKFLLDTKGKFGFTDPDRGMSVYIKSEISLPLFLLWAGEGEKFCIEPWSAGVNTLNTGKGLIWIRPGMMFESGFSIKAEARR